MTQTKHTPTPWRYDPEYPCIESTVQWMIDPDPEFDIDGVRTRVVDLHMAMSGDDPGADAERIVACVNAMDAAGIADPSVVPELVEKLKDFVELADDSQGVAGYHLNGEIAEWDYFDFVEGARSLLEKAGKR